VHVVLLVLFHFLHHHQQQAHRGRGLRAVPRPSRWAATCSARGGGRGVGHRDGRRAVESCDYNATIN
jgi:hypothetical protein